MSDSVAGSQALQEKLLEIIDESSRKNSLPVNSLKLATLLNVDHQRIVGAIKSLQSLGELIAVNQLETKRLELTAEGELIANRGSHEALVFEQILKSGPNGIPQDQLMKSFQDPQTGKLGFSKAMSAGWITLDKNAKPPVVKAKVNTITDEVQQILSGIKNLSLAELPDSKKADLKKRKLLQEAVIKSYDLSKGKDFTLTIKKQDTELTSEMILKGTWKETQFKEYNFDALGVAPQRGHLHPLLKVRAKYRQIFLDMGFTEMPTNNYVESSFWNFDALFQPQQHPARDAHDTFFLSEPANCQVDMIPSDYLEIVKKTHSKGGFGSQGYNYDWKKEEAAKNLLRTHTTAVSARMLYKVAQEYKASKTWTPVKYFSIDRVFRNENLDSTHLAEFHQIEGVVADVGLTLGDLMGILEAFFKKLGIEELRFKPAYNPYTEPSMEVFSYHKGLKKWIEIGNSGVFRPEMLLPMGLPPDVTVIAWGLSLERPTMIMYGIDNIRDLVGHKVNLEMVYKNPICILNKPAN